MVNEITTHEFCDSIYIKMKYTFNMPNKIQFSGRI